MKKTNKKYQFFIILTITLVMLVIENGFYFRGSLSYMMELSGGLPLLDMRFWYTPNEAYALFDQLQEFGRGEYRFLLTVIDVVLPLFIAMTVRSALALGTFTRFKNLAFFGMAIDYAENISILMLLSAYSERSDGLVYVAATFSMLKNSLAFSFLTLIVMGYFKNNPLAKFIERKCPRAVG